jgi:GNAT superfamily N-acetyltransferase
MTVQLELRPAREEDEEAVNALSSHIWEGDDYVPRLFHRWLADDTGRFTVAYEGDHLVGFGKLTKFSPGEWWLEGLRVHPQHRGRGIARCLHRHAVGVALDIGAGTLRFATSSKNTAVHKLAAETGFKKVSEHVKVEAEAKATAGEEHGFAPLKPAELSPLRHWLNRSERYAALAGLFEHHWQWKELAPRLQSLLAEGRIYWWHKTREGAQGVVVVAQEKEERLHINYLDAAPESLRPLATALRRLAAQLGMERVAGKPPAGDPYRRAFRAAGWQLEPDYELWLFARSLNRAASSLSPDISEEKEHENG